jgi:hypothetical protein
MEINILVSKLDEIKIRKNIKEIESSKKKIPFTSLTSNYSLIHTKKKLKHVKLHFGNKL